MSPPWEQMQFVSNLISSKLFCFPPLPLWPTWTALKGELYRHMFSVCFDIGRQEVGIIIIVLRGNNILLSIFILILFWRRQIVSKI